MKRSAGSLHALTKEPRKNPNAKPWKGDAGVNINFHRARIAVCAQVITAIKKDLLARRVGLTPARPPREKFIHPPAFTGPTAEQINEILGKPHYA